MRKVIDGEFLAMLEGRDLQIRNPMQGFFGGNRRSKSYGSSAEFADFREYVPGDDLRRIDWNLYVRFEKLFLKLYVDERQLHHKIYIDASASMDWGEPDKAQAALKLAAALANLSVQAMDRVSLFAIHGDRCQRLCPAILGREAFYAAAEALNRLEFYGECDLGQALSQDEDRDGDGLRILISDFLTDSQWKHAVERLRYLGREVWLIQVLSPDEISPVMNGKLKLLDKEQADPDAAGHYHADVHRTALKAYGDAFAWLQKDIQDFCSARQIGYLQLSTEYSIEKMLFQQATEAGLVL